ncbi:Toll-Interleukin-Resistance domain family protein [Prunus dulcis]|uniref:Toll-Interleukin-Resistance domain family protein n=1 Tax=Prunus dulcis TaxID=3755 RepID=A0A4Y1RB60_PRUDU|nr:Toll-Interleukin-Resistance domain family protein [Prunus dulcis]
MTKVGWKSDNSRKKKSKGPGTSESAEWIFLVTSLGLEMLSAAFDQASSPTKPHYAYLERVVLRRWGRFWWFYYPPPRNAFFGTLPDIYGLVGGISQCICSVAQYMYYLRHADNPIKVSILPAIFLMCLGGSKLNRNQRNMNTIEHNMFRKRQLLHSEVKEVVPHECLDLPHWMEAKPGLDHQPWSVLIINHGILTLKCLQLKDVHVFSRESLAKVPVRNAAGVKTAYKCHQEGRLLDLVDKSLYTYHTKQKPSPS